MTETDVVTYEQHGPIAVVTMNRPQYRNAQNSAMTYALDDGVLPRPPPTTTSR